MNYLYIGDKWRSRRKLLTPSFHFKILETSLEGMCRNTEQFVSSLLATGGKPTEIQELIRLSTLKIICGNIHFVNQLFLWQYFYAESYFINK